MKSTIVNNYKLPFITIHSSHTDMTNIILCKCSGGDVLMSADATHLLHEVSQLEILHPRDCSGWGHTRLQPEQGREERKEEHSNWSTPGLYIVYWQRSDFMIEYMTNSTLNRELWGLTHLHWFLYDRPGNHLSRVGETKPQSSKLHMITWCVAMAMFTSVDTRVGTVALICVQY